MFKIYYSCFRDTYFCFNYGIQTYSSLFYANITSINALEDFDILKNTNICQHCIAYYMQGRLQALLRRESCSLWKCFRVICYLSKRMC